MTPIIDNEKIKDDLSRLCVMWLIAEFEVQEQQSDRGHVQHHFRQHSAHMSSAHIYNERPQEDGTQMNATDAQSWDRALK